MDLLFNLEKWTAFFMLVSIEIVLEIDNILFISILN